MLTHSQISKHASRESCWVIIRDNVYDLTSFVDSHPGGAKTILKYAGRDATHDFEQIHSSNIIDKHLKSEQKLGPLVGSSEPLKHAGKQKQIQTSLAKKPRLSSVINLRDFELAASHLLSPKSFAFFKSGADDEWTAQWNRDSWRAVRFRPRVLRRITNVDISTEILGNRFSAPFFICPAGGAKLAHPSGDILLTQAAGVEDVLQWVCNNAGCTQQEICDNRASSQALYWQIYAVNDLAATEAEIRQAIARGFKGFALTVDAIRAGKRERDVRTSLEEDDTVEDGEDDDGFAAGPTVKRPDVWTEFEWPSAIEWLRSITDLPIAVKGIQCWEDAALCKKYRVHPWLSNHGGRQLDGAPSAVETLLSVRKHCPEVFDHCQVVVDGGILRGTDIVKALALGAKGVGIGRGFLYSMVYGRNGVTKAIRILKHEVETAMALLGVTEISQLNPSLVDVSSLVHASVTSRAYL